MKLIKPSVEFIDTLSSSLDNIYNNITYAARTCYKSTYNDSIEDNKKFVDRLINSKHTAMLEHGTMYFDISVPGVFDTEYLRKINIINFFKQNKYSKVNKYNKEHIVDDNTTINIEHYAITTNYRVFIEQIEFSKLKETSDGYFIGVSKEYLLQFLCEPTEHHEKRYTFKITTDRGVSHELVRHRVFSFAQESTRYCNYSKDKFGNEVTFVVPAWFRFNNSDEYNLKEIIFMESCTQSENNYLNLLKEGCKPQEARNVLTNALKTEIIMTGYECDWKEFLKIRYEGTTGAPHPDMKLITNKIAEILYK